MTSYPPPMCMLCSRNRGGIACDAFPDRIPDAILQSRYDHRRPYKGDHGVRFEPIDDNAAEAVAATFDDDT